VFENKVPRRIFGPNWEEVVRGWRNLHNEELHNLFSHMGQINAYNTSVGNCKGRDHLVDLSLDGNLVILTLS
jgi:hypothetical protein